MQLLTKVHLTHTVQVQLLTKYTSHTRKQPYLPACQELLSNQAARLVQEVPEAQQQPCHWCQTCQAFQVIRATQAHRGVPSIRGGPPDPVGLGGPSNRGHQVPLWVQEGPEPLPRHQNQTQEPGQGSRGAPVALVVLAGLGRPEYLEGQ